MNKKLFLIIGAILLIAIGYSSLYLGLPWRSQGRARGIETYVFRRDFRYDFEIYTFVPAAFFESLLIRLFPKPFLTNPEWLASGYPIRLTLKADKAYWDFPIRDSSLDQSSPQAAGRGSATTP